MDTNQSWVSSRIQEALEFSNMNFANAFLKKKNSFLKQIFSEALEKKEYIEIVCDIAYSSTLSLMPNAALFKA